MGVVEDLGTGIGDVSLMRMRTNYLCIAKNNLCLSVFIPQVNTKS